jgi:hypothetical protein
MCASGHLLEASSQRQVSAAAVLVKMDPCGASRRRTFNDAWRVCGDGSFGGLGDTCVATAYSAA